VATNVPYLGRGKQDPVLAKYCAEFHSDAKADLATCFVDRCLRFCQEGGSVALVTPQNWLFLTSYKKLRERLLKAVQWDFVARLGERAFDSPAAAGAFAALLGLTRRAPAPEHAFAGWDVDSLDGAEGKGNGLRSTNHAVVPQRDQLRNPSVSVSFEKLSGGTNLGSYGTVFYGSKPGQTARVTRVFWELPEIRSDQWVFMESSPNNEYVYSGKAEICLSLTEIAAQEIEEFGVRGDGAWGHLGVIFAKIRDLPCSLYLGQFYDDNTYVIVPRHISDLPTFYSYAQSGQLNTDARKYNRKLNITRELVEALPFDVKHWREVARTLFPYGLPRPHSDDPTQWLFSGHPKGSDHPLQVAVARLVGYRWPRQTGSSFPDCPALGPDGLEAHADADGIVPLASIAGEASAADRLRALLADAYGDEWSAAKLRELLGNWDSLEDWLRDGFFEEHCRIFHQRPFVWHIWDGRKDGFHALVNYHRLAAPNGEGRQTLEKLIYTYLGRWIERQQDEVKAGKEGAEARLTAALHLKGELEEILEGEKPYDIFIRWKPLHQQPIGWEPDINDGVRLNIRPWLQTTLAPVTKPRKGACVLRVTPKIKYGKDRGKEPHRPKEDYPWFWSWDERTDDFPGGEAFDGARWNDLHYSLKTKKQARERKQATEVKP